MTTEKEQAKTNLLTPLQVSEMLGVKESTLMVWRSTGRYSLPFVKIGWKAMYRLEDIQAFIERRTRNFDEEQVTDV